MIGQKNPVSKISYPPKGTTQEPLNLAVVIVNLQKNYVSNKTTKKRPQTCAVQFDLHIKIQKRKTE